MSPISNPSTTIPSLKSLGINSLQVSGIYLNDPNLGNKGFIECDPKKPDTYNIHGGVLAITHRGQLYIAAPSPANTTILEQNGFTRDTGLGVPFSNGPNTYNTFTRERSPSTYAQVNDFMCGEMELEPYSKKPSLPTPTAAGDRNLGALTAG